MELSESLRQAGYCNVEQLFIPPKGKEKEAMKLSQDTFLSKEVLLFSRIEITYEYKF